MRPPRSAVYNMTLRVTDYIDQTTWIKKSSLRVALLRRGPLSSLKFLIEAAECSTVWCGARVRVESFWINQRGVMADGYSKAYPFNTSNR